MTTIVVQPGDTIIMSEPRDAYREFSEVIQDIGKLYETFEFHEEEKGMLDVFREMNGIASGEITLRELIERANSYRGLHITQASFKNWLVLFTASTHLAWMEKTRAKRHGN